MLMLGKTNWFVYFSRIIKVFLFTVLFGGNFMQTSNEKKGDEN